MQTACELCDCGSMQCLAMAECCPPGHGPAIEQPRRTNAFQRLKTGAIGLFIRAHRNQWPIFSGSSIALLRLGCPVLVLPVLAIGGHGCPDTNNLRFKRRDKPTTCTLTNHRSCPFERLARVPEHINSRDSQVGDRRSHHDVSMPANGGCLDARAHCQPLYCSVMQRYEALCTVMQWRVGTRENCSQRAKAWTRQVNKQKSSGSRVLRGVHRQRQLRGSRRRIADTDGSL